MLLLMAAAYGVSTLGPGEPDGRAGPLFRLRAGGFSASSGMGPVTIAVDSYGPVTDKRAIGV